MTLLTKKPVRVALVSSGALLCFALVVFFSTRSPGSAQTAFAETKAPAAVSADSLSFLEGMQKANRVVFSTQSLTHSLECPHSTKSLLRISNLPF